MHTICHFKSWEVRSPELQTVLDLELKRRSYGRLKTIVQSWTEMLQPHPILLLLDTFLEHFLDLKLCIPYVFSKLGKSGVQRFKRCMIWSWNKKFMAVWRRTRKAEWEFRIQDAIWKGVSQLRNHPLEHECHFVAPYVHFTTAKWAAKIPLLREILPPLQKWPPSFKMATKMLQASKWVAKFPFGWEMFSQPHSYPLWNYPWAAKNVFLYSLWLQDDLQAAKWPPSYKNDLQNEERFAKTLWKAKGSYENANIVPQPYI